MKRDGNLYCVFFYLLLYLYLFAFIVGIIIFLIIFVFFRDHEYEPINTQDDVERPHSSGSVDVSANASVYEPIQDPNAPEAEADEDAAPVVTDGSSIGPRRKSFIDSAGDRTRQIRASISSQAGALRTKLQNLKRPARSASREKAPESVETEAEHEEVNYAADVPDAEAEIHVDETVDEAKEPKKSRIALDKLKSVQMPKLRKPQFKRPEFTKKLKAPEFKMRMPERPAFTRAENYSFRFRKQASAPEADADTAGNECQTQRSASEEPPQRKQRSPKAAKTKRFDFGTYPRIFSRLRKQSQPDTSGGTDFSTTASVSRGNDSQDTQETGDGGRQRKLGPITFGTFPRMGRRSILTTSTERSDSAQDTNSVRTDQFEPMRDESVERRLTERLQQAMAGSIGELGAGESLAGSLAVDTAEPTAEQKQLAEYDEENREIHQISKAREGEFRQRRPKLKHQESDLTSEAESTREQAWESVGPTTGLGRLKTRMEEEWERTTHGHEEEAADDHALAQHGVDVPADFHPIEMDTDRLSTQETQSSGSSGYMRRKGVIEDHEDIDRHTDYSHSDHDLHFESESAILGGSKASTDRMDTFYGDRQQADSFDSADKYKPTAPGRRNRQHPDAEESAEVDDLSDSLRHSRHFDEYPDDEPVDEKVADLQAKVDEYEDEFERLFFKHHQHLEDYQLQRGDIVPDEEDDDLDGMHQNIIMASMERTSGTPPVAPRRRKRKSMERPSGRPEPLFGRDKSETPRSDRGAPLSHDVRYTIDN